MDTIESLIATANSRGLWLANLFQLLDGGQGTASSPAHPTGIWQANFHHATGWYEFGKGNTPLAALAAALARCGGAKTPEVPDPFS